MEKGTIKDPGYVKLKKLYEFFERERIKEGRTIEEICIEDIISAKLGDLLIDTNKKMRKNQITQIPVLDKNGCYIGWIDDKKMTTLLSLKDEKIRISEKMLDPLPPKIQHDVYAIRLEDFFSYYDYALVEKNGKICGICAREDFNKFLEEERVKRNMT